MRAFVWAAVAAVTLPVGLPAQTGAYRTLLSGREITNEVFTWSGHTLDATADVTISGTRLVTRTAYDDAWVPQSYDVRVISMATGAVQRVAHVTLGDSTSWTINGGPATALARALPAPRAVMQNLLWSHLGAIARRLPPADSTLALHTLLVDNGMVLDVKLARRGTQVVVQVATSEVTLTLDRDGDLASASAPAQGLVIERVSADSVTAARPLVVQPTVQPPAGVSDAAFSWTDGAQPLSGRLAMPAAPAGKVPVVLIVAGSGPTDRDGNNPLGVQSAVYRKLAWALAERGIASLRYDKRGIGASPFTGDAAAVTFDDFVNDAAAGAGILARDPRFSKVVVVGHSEGALIALRVANSGVPVAGVVTMAGMGRTLTAVLREQIAQQTDSAGLAAFDRELAAYLADGPMPDVTPAWRILLNPGVRVFLKTENRLDPAGEARSLKVPLLILQGATDVQVSVADAEALKAAQPAAELHVLPATSHMFVRADSRSPADQSPGYQDAAATLVPDLVPLLVGFVERVTR